MRCNPSLTPFNVGLYKSAEPSDDCPLVLTVDRHQSKVEFIKCLSYCPKVSQQLWMSRVVKCLECVECGSPSRSVGADIAITAITAVIGSQWLQSLINRRSIAEPNASFAQLKAVFVSYLCDVCSLSTALFDIVWSSTRTRVSVSGKEVKAVSELWSRL